MKHFLFAFCLALSACAPVDWDARRGTSVAQTVAAWPWPTEALGPTETPPPSLPPTITITLEPSPTVEVTPTLELPNVEGGDCIPLDTLRQIAQVASLTDGDTIRVDIDGANYPLRYIGMDTAEANEPYGSTATAANRALVEGKTVLLVKDVSETDQYDRLLRYVIADGIFVNYDLVRNGHARAADYPPDSSCALTFATAERHAREEGQGMWAATPTPRPEPTAIPLPTATFSPAPTPRSGDCDPAYPTVCIPSPPPDLDCKDVPYRRFKVLPPDPHHFDGDHDGIGCESG